MKIEAIAHTVDMPIAVALPVRFGKNMGLILVK